MQISSRPSLALAPPTNLRSPSVHSAMGVVASATIRNLMNIYEFTRKKNQKIVERLSQLASRIHLARFLQFQPELQQRRSSIVANVP